MFKTYKSKITNLSLPITVDGKERRIEFRGGLPGKGFYNTANRAEQVAIERHRRFGKTIFLVGEYPQQENDDENVEESEDVSTDENAEDLNVVPADENMLVVEECSTVQAAKEWLMANAGASQADVKNKQAVLAYASNKGISFPNL